MVYKRRASFAQHPEGSKQKQRKADEEDTSERTSPGTITLIHVDKR